MVGVGVLLGVPVVLSSAGIATLLLNNQVERTCIIDHLELLVVGSEDDGAVVVDLSVVGKRNVKKVSSVLGESHLQGVSSSKFHFVGKSNSGKGDKLHL